MIVALLEKLRLLQVSVQVKDDQLVVKAPGGVVDHALLEEIRNNKQAILSFLTGTTGQQPKGHVITKADFSADYPLSSAQQRLWTLSQLQGSDIAYNTAGVYLVEGNLDPEMLQQAFGLLIERHESLRTVFRENAAGEVRQLINPPAHCRVNVSVNDLRTEPGREMLVRELVAAASAAPFDISSDVLLRACLCREADGRWIICCVIHHIVSDGWSMGVLVNELLYFYNACLNRVQPGLKPLPVQYKDYAVWQQQRLLSGKMDMHKSYWMQQLSGELPVLDIYGDYPRPAVKTYKGAECRLRVSRETADALKQVARKNDATFFMSLYAALLVLLHRCTGQQDIVIGTPVAGRDTEELAGQIGFYVNMLPLRAAVDGRSSFNDLLRSVKKIMLEAFSHQSFPFDGIVDALDIRQDMSRHPLFDVVIVLQNAWQPDDTAATTGGGLRLSRLSHFGTRTSKFDLTFIFTEYQTHLEAAVEYNTDIFKEASVKRIAQHLSTLLEVLASEPSASIGKVRLIDDAGMHQLLREFGSREVPYPRNATVTELFERQVRATPDNIALVFGENEWSYRKLNQVSNRLAAYLSARVPVQPDSLTGIRLQRSDWLIVSVLAVLKAGGAYVPLDTDYPADRIEFMIKDCNCSTVIDDAFLHDFRQQMEQYSDADTPSAAGPENLIYVMYTSGSTGVPKGVMVQHRSVVRLVFPCSFVNPAAKAALLSTGAVSFDATTFEYWSMLLYGKKLVLCSNETLLDAEKLGNAIRSNGVDMMWFTAGWLNQLADTDIEVFEGLTTVIAGGDRLSPAHIDRLLERYPGMEIINGYGPTENTTFTLTCRAEKGMSNIPIGKPVNNTTVYILDSYDNPVPAGVPGEICTGGDGLARGYLNRAALTAEKFTASPFVPGERIYRTGDTGRWLEDGNIEFIGRGDSQVKIRGYRIETGEVEAAIQQCPGVDSCIVVAKTAGGEKELVAYITGGAAADPALIRAQLSSTLPAFMLPAYIVQLPELPLTPNGKVDRNALPDPVAGAAAATAYIAPRTAMETALAAIWEQVLAAEKVGAAADFFELGGHSLKITKLAAAIHQQLNIRVTLKELFSCASLEKQAALLALKTAGPYSTIEAVPVQPCYPLSEAQALMWTACQLGTANAAYNIPAVCMLEGQPDPEAMCHAFAALAERHEILRTVFRPDGNGEVKQYILNTEEAVCVPAFYDLQHLGEQEHNERLAALCSMPFDLAAGPLLRACLFKVKDNAWIFACVMHHIVSDGWSLNIMLNDLLVFYNAGLKGARPELPVLAIQYKDYAAWHNNCLQGEQSAYHRQYWMSRLEGTLPKLDLKIAGERPAVKTYRGNTTERIIDAGTAAGLKKLCRDMDGTLFMGLLAAVNVLLYKYSGQEDIICGTSVAGREHAALEHQIGYYLNTLPLRLQVKGRDSFSGLFAAARQVCLDAYEHQAYPFARIVDDAGVQRDPGRNNLFDVYVLLQNNEKFDAAAGRAEGMTIRRYDKLPLSFSKFDLSFTFSEEEAGIRLRLEYSSSIFKQADIEQLADYFAELLLQIIDNPFISLRIPDGTAAGEKIDFLNEFAAQHDQAVMPAIPGLTGGLLMHAGGSVRLSPDGGETDLAELNAMANRLCRFLRQHGMAGPGIVTGIKFTEPGWRLLMTLGVLKAGGTYLRIEETWTEQYTRSILNHSKCSFVAGSSTTSAFNGEAGRHSAEEPSWVQDYRQAAAILYSPVLRGEPVCIRIPATSVLAAVSWELYSSSGTPGNATAAMLLDAAGESVTSLYRKVKKHISAAAAGKAEAALFTAPLSTEF